MSERYVIVGGAFNAGKSAALRRFAVSPIRILMVCGHPAFRGEVAVIKSMECKALESMYKVEAE